MSDPNMVDFYKRVAKVRKQHAKGYGMEAAGTLGRSYYTKRRKSSGLRFVAPLLILVGFAFVTKAVLHAKVGAADYDGRIANMQAGTELDRVGAFLLSADPVTVFLSEQFTQLGL
jgi:hypothetical protein